MYIWIIRPYMNSEYGREVRGVCCEGIFKCFPVLGKPTTTHSAEVL